MKVSLRWLSEFISLPHSPREIADRLTLSGLEVEGVHAIGTLPESLVTGKILAMKPHPNADRLTLCTVQGEGEPVQVVCGAKNMQPGDIVPFAQVGTVLASGLKIEKAKLRGESSAGMLCSARELGLSEDHAGLLILPAETPIGIPVARVLPPSDTVLDVSVTTNRSDCLSVLGIARELSALFDMPLKISAPHFSRPILNGQAAPAWQAQAGATPATLEVQSSQCPQYLGRVMEGVKIGPSPAWLVERLAAVGLRSINNVVDATNYVMMERGQPLHAFDLDRLATPRVVVRQAVRGEKILCLDGVERQVDERDLVITDANGPIAIAGVMGGELSSVQNSTTRLFLEAAWFAPKSVRATARRAGLHTDSSHRFERGVDPGGVGHAMDALTALIAQLAGGQVVGDLLRHAPHDAPASLIQAKPSRMRTLLGMDIPDTRMVAHLVRLAMQVTMGDDLLEVLAPSYRLDISTESDLAEEVARVEGYEHVPTRLPRGDFRVPFVAPRRQMLRQAVRFLAGCGLQQAINYTFISPLMIEALRLPEGDRRRELVRLKNPISEEMSVMRTSIIPSLLKNAAYNSRREHADLKLFEVGKIFLSNGAMERPTEVDMLGVLLTGAREARGWTNSTPSELDLYDMKGVLESLVGWLRPGEVSLRPDDPEPFLAPGQGWSVVWAGERIGSLGILHPDLARSLGLEKPVVLLELELGRLWQSRQTLPTYTQIPRFPKGERDLGLLVPERVTAEELLSKVKALGGPLLEKAMIFDLYRGKNIPEGLKSVAVGLVFRAEDRTLVESEVQESFERILEGVKTSLGASLRK